MRIKRLIYKDAFHYIWIPAIFSIISTCVQYVLLVRCAEILGYFTDAVFALDWSSGLQQLGRVGLALAVTIFIVPAMNLICDVLLVKYSCYHDRMVLSRFLDKKCSEVEKLNAGEMLDRIFEDPNEFRLDLLSICSAVVLIPVTTVYLIINVMRISPLYFLIVFVVSLVKFFVPLLVKRQEKEYHKESKEYSSEIQSFETDLTTRAHMINLFGIGEAMMLRIDSRYRTYFEKIKKKSIRLSIAADSAKSVVDKLCIVIVLLVGACFVAKNQISPGAVAAMMGYFSIINRVIAQGETLIHTCPIVNTLVERLTYFYECAEKSDGKDLNDIKQISVENLSFSYENNLVFDSLSFNVNKGDKVVLCGKNGSGKSTLLKVLLGLLEGYSGRYKINGEEFSAYMPASVYGAISYAPQTPYLFKETVLENIMLANPHAKVSEVKQLMDYFGIGHLSEQTVGTDEDGVSGGEKQKISILRAMIKNTSAIIIDEPENNLDLTALEKLKEWIKTSDKTIIYVSHNPEIIDCANKQVVLRGVI